MINYNFNNLYRGEQNVSCFLYEHFKNYLNDIKLGLKGNNDCLDKSLLEDIESNLDMLTDISKIIINIVKVFENGYIKQAYDQAYKLFNKYHDLFLTEDYNHYTNLCFTRLRTGKFQSDEKKELFHIPQNKSELIGSFRYSAAGFPCLYLASDLELCWYECGMPKEYSFCYMKIAENEKLKLINFKERPLDFFSSNMVHLYNAQNKGIKDAIESINKK